MQARCAASSLALSFVATKRQPTRHQLSAVSHAGSSTACGLQGRWVSAVLWKLLHAGDRNLSTIRHVVLRCLMVDRLRSPVHVHLFACSYCFLIFPTVAATAADQLDAVHHHYERTAQVCRSCLHHDSSHDTGVPMCINHGVHSFWEHDRPAQVSLPARTASSSSADLWGEIFGGFAARQQNLFEHCTTVLSRHLVYAPIFF
jgi:hypothetical protein